MSELREFIYLDSMSVNSLLASQYVALPETVRSVSEELEGGNTEAGIGGSLGIAGHASIEANISSGEHEEGRQLSEIERRVNEQYRFSILYNTLVENDQLTDLSDYSADNGLSLEQGDTIKINGKFETDPFYRLLSAISLMMRIEQAREVPNQPSEDFEELDGMNISEDQNVFDTWKDILHGEQIGLKIESEEFRYPLVMSLEYDNLWTNPEREFLGSQNYTVVGRVKQVLNGNEKWDFVDLLRIMDSVFAEESVENFREAFRQVSDEIGEIGEEEGEFSFDITIDEEDYLVDERAIVIEPIAIYW